MKLQNLHTHTVFGDGAGTAEEMAQGAIQAGCGSLGFSEHSPLLPFYDPDHYAIEEAVLPAYCAEILRLREQYRGQLDIFLGLEQEYDSPPPTEKFDYLIGSVHNVVADGCCLSVDNTREVLAAGVARLFGGDYYALAETYYQRTGLVAKKTECQIVGHFDLLTKFNEGGQLFDETAPRYVDAAIAALEALLRRDVVFEVNTGAISRGCRSAPYPAPFLLRAIRERGGRICIASDSHSPRTLTSAFPLAAELALSCGFQETWMLTADGFQAVSLEAFLAEARRAGIDRGIV